MCLDQKLLDSDTATGSTTATATATWTGAAAALKIKVVFNVGASDDCEVTDIQTSRNASSGTYSVVFTVTGTTIDMTGSVYGCRYLDADGNELTTDTAIAAEGYSVGEVINVNGVESENQSQVLDNPLILDIGEAFSVTERLNADFGNVPFVVDITDTFLNSLLDMNDTALVVSEDLFIENLFELTKIEHHIESEVKKYSVFQLTDTGETFTEVVCDRGTTGETGGDLLYSDNAIYDSRFRIGVTQEEIDADNDYTKPILL